MSVVMTVLLSLADGVLAQIGSRTEYYLLFKTWSADFRYLFEQGLYAAILLFVGAKFFETRTILTIGFDRVDAARMAVRGPDDDNVVWVGRRYATRLEAQAVAEAMVERIGGGQSDKIGADRGVPG